MSTDYTIDIEIDTRGLNCPLPILKAKRALTGMESGQVLKVVATDAGSIRDFQAFAKQTGNELVERVGTNMGDVVAAIGRVSTLVGEIAASAKEEALGLAQVNTAVNQMDQVTQQNAALVEQSTAAAESLKDQAQRLNTVVGTFRLNTGGLAA